MKSLKVLLTFLLVVYVIMAVNDYIAIRNAGTKEFCQHWIHTIPWWGHMAMPGPANACIDLGFWP